MAGTKNKALAKLENDNLRWLALGEQTESEVDSQVHAGLVSLVPQCHACECVTVCVFNMLYFENNSSYQFRIKKTIVLHLR